MSDFLEAQLRQLLQRTQDEQGFVVLGSHDELKVPSTVPAWEAISWGIERVQWPLRVIAKATRDDLDRQAMIFGTKNLRRIYSHYYRAVAE